MTQETEKSAEDKQVEQQQEDAAFASGYGDVRGEPTVKPEPKAEKQEEVKAEEKAPETAKAEEEKPDPVAAKLDQVLASLGQLDQRVRKNEGQFGSLNSTVKQLAEAGKAAVAAAPAAQKAEVASKVDEQLKQVGADLPDVAALANSLREELRNELKLPDVVTKADFEKAVEERLAKAKEEAKAEAANARVLALIDAKHDGWEATINTPEFEAWHGKQAPEVQALSGSAKAHDAIRLLDLFKADQEKARLKAEEDKANADRLKRAAPPKGVAHPPTTTINDDDAFASGWKAVRSG